MSKHITHEIVFKKTTPKALYDLYMNSKKHSIATGAPASITSKPCAEFSAHGGYITGKNIYLKKDANKELVSTKVQTIYSITSQV